MRFEEESSQIKQCTQKCRGRSEASILSETLPGELVSQRSAIFIKFDGNKVNSEEAKGPSLGLSEEADRHLVPPWLEMFR